LRLDDSPSGGARVRLELPGDPVSHEEVRAELRGQVDGMALAPGGRA
jgi:hypothetical protein